MTIEESRFGTTTASSSSTLNVKGHTLIIPCVSIGSVPQLAIDALIEPENATKIFGQPAQLISTLDHRFCVPFLGGVQLGDSEEALPQGPLRVYSFERAKVTVLQQRSPIIKSRKQDYVKNLIKWIKQQGFMDVVVLTSLDAGLRNDAQMRHSFWLVDSGVKGQSPIIEKMKAELPAY
ncbi:hypothetical protein CBS101457_003575 [Exobasidium rhododendri]|nr:hypothetical protein CBS101457_003575 [Exobasidium rhododendri]